MLKTETNMRSQVMYLTSDLLLEPLRSGRPVWPHLHLRSLKNPFHPRPGKTSMQHEDKKVYNEPNQLTKKECVIAQIAYRRSHTNSHQHTWFTCFFSFVR